MVQEEWGGCCSSRDGCWGIDPSQDESQGDAQRKTLWSEQANNIPDSASLSRRSVMIGGR